MPIDVQAAIEIAASAVNLRAADLSGHAGAPKEMPIIMRDFEIQQIHVGHVIEIRSKIAAHGVHANHIALISGVAINNGLRRQGFRRVPDAAESIQRLAESIADEFRQHFAVVPQVGKGNVLKRNVALGKRQYGQFDHNSVKRANYNPVHAFRGGVPEISEELKRRPSDSIRVAISPGGREVEGSSTYEGFLRDRNRIRHQIQAALA